MKANLCNIIIMHHKYNKPLTIIVLISMLLTPMQAVLALTVPVSNGDMMSMAMEIQENHDKIPMHDASNTCDKCQTSHCCNGANCVSAQCASCMPGMFITISPYYMGSSTSTLLSVIQNVHINTSTSNLYRPPRA